MAKSKNTVEYTDGAETYERLHKQNIIKMDTEKEASVEAWSHMPEHIRWTTHKAQEFLKGFMNEWQMDKEDTEEITYRDIP